MDKEIYIAGGCFWGVEEYYSQLKGVIESVSGYANGTKENPTYEEVKSGQYNFVECVRIKYDDNIISLEKILEHYLRFIDPYSLNKQGEDIGIQYRSGVYSNSLEERKRIKEYFDNTLKKDYLIEIKELENYFLAEEYHQQYLKKHVNGYCHINLNLINKKEKK